MLLGLFQSWAPTFLSREQCVTLLRKLLLSKVTLFESIFLQNNYIHSHDHLACLYSKGLSQVAQS